MCGRIFGGPAGGDGDSLFDGVAVGDDAAWAAAVLVYRVGGVAAGAEFVGGVGIAGAADIASAVRNDHGDATGVCDGAGAGDCAGRTGGGAEAGGEEVDVAVFL